ncbi:MAG: EAL domain-containing response regulator [Sphingobacteriia bacterium]|nr:EAL domain-containing response regulator [Sphingobacteriia bacterium]NCC37884.1 EAL domain-containing response regulator [Gammaproteobacteria bacterium]
MARILIVEDSRIQAEMLRRVLVEEGHQINIGRDGAEGLELARASRPDLIISDVTMPVMNGFDLCRGIRADPDLDSVPVILLTAMSGVEDVIEGLNAGADNYVAKPYDTALLLERVAMALARPSGVARESKIRLRATAHGGRVEVVTGPQQMLDLLLSIYDNALEQNRLLTAAQDQLATLNARLEADNQRKTETVHHLQFYDRLTGLANRRLLLERLSAALAACAQGGCHAAILVVNLDDFRLLNDSKGYDSGDRLLLGIAERLASLIRPGDSLARLGADEFALLLTDIGATRDQAIASAMACADHVLSTIQRPFDLGDEQYLCKASIGISLCGGDEQAPANVLKHASLALAAAKRAGYNQVEFFGDRMRIQVEQRFTLESQLRHGIPDELALMYQGQVDHRGVVMGAEVLVRWQHPHLGMVSPATFIPLAEETALIQPIGQWVLRTVCRQIKAWESDPRLCRLLLAVNVSAQEFKQPDFVDQVTSILRATGANPGRLKLELTESILATDTDDVVAKMTVLKSRGISFALDDFGTGFSSLSYLKKMPIDQLKIDRSFIRDITTDANDASIVRTVIALGHSLGLAVIAEGVETEAQRDFLARNGCTEYQGFLFSRPVPVEDFIRMLALSDGAKETSRTPRQASTA